MYLLQPLRSHITSSAATAGEAAATKPKAAKPSAEFFRILISVINSSHFVAFPFRAAGRSCGARKSFSQTSTAALSPRQGRFASASFRTGHKTRRSILRLETLGVGVGRAAKSDCLIWTLRADLYPRFR